MGRFNPLYSLVPLQSFEESTKFCNCSLCEVRWQASIVLLAMAVDSTQAHTTEGNAARRKHLCNGVGPTRPSKEPNSFGIRARSVCERFQPSTIHLNSVPRG